jgi:RNA polymerase sigma-70 factor (ECF subfamily)
MERTMVQTDITGNLQLDEDVYRQYSAQVFAYLLRHIPIYQDAEEVLLDVFLVVLDELPALPEHRHAAFVHTVARNKMVDYFRRRDKFKQVSLDELVDTPFADDDPETHLLTSERNAAVSRAISTLPALQQAILQLRFAHDLRVKEIATRLAKSEQAVRMALCRALKQLKKIVPIEIERS